MNKQNRTLKIIIIGFVSILLQGSFVNCQSIKQDSLLLKGPYLGQKAPGSHAHLFAPGIVSTKYFEHSSPVFTPDLKEIYWSTQIEEDGKDVAKPIYYMKMIDNVWTKPEIPSFAKDLPVAESPFITPDGKKLYFWAMKGERFTIYYVNRVNDGWSDPINLGQQFNQPKFAMVTPSVSKNGTVYFHGLRKDGLYYSTVIDGKYQPPVFMGGQFYSGETDGTPYIAPDEHYLIFSSFRKGGFGNGDLYVCFKQKDGSWSKIINMGSTINTEANERFPNVTPDGKYLFFNSTRKIAGAGINKPGNGQGDVYWIDATIIEELKPKEK